VELLESEPQDGPNDRSAYPLKDSSPFENSPARCRIRGFITIFSPFSGNPNVDPGVQQARQAQVLTDLESYGERLPFAMFPATRLQ
jgi:hypothetical protein